MSATEYSLQEISEDTGLSMAQLARLTSRQINDIAWATADEWEHASDEIPCDAVEPVESDIPTDEEIDDWLAYQNEREPRAIRREYDAYEWRFGDYDEYEGDDE